jgi:hypothetical protein
MSGRYCNECEEQRIKDSKLRYRMGHSLFEDGYEIPYNAINDRWDTADYALAEDENKHFTWEDMVVMRQEGDLPDTTQLIDLRTGNTTYLGLLEDIDMENIPDHDKYLDPPEYPTHGECDGCHEMFDYDDMTVRGDKWYCNECMDDILDEIMAEDEE